MSDRWGLPMAAHEMDLCFVGAIFKEGNAPKRIHMQGGITRARPANLARERFLSTLELLTICRAHSGGGVFVSFLLSPYFRCEPNANFLRAGRPR